MKSKDPGPEGPALVHPAGVIWVTNLTSSVQDSGFDFLLTPETRNRLDLWQSRSSLTCPEDQVFNVGINYAADNPHRLYLAVQWLHSN